MSLCWKFKVRSFYNSINWTGLLTESTVDALCHVNVIPEKLVKCEEENELGDEREMKGRGQNNSSPSSPTATIFSFLSLNCNCLCWANLMNNNYLVSSNAILSLTKNNSNNFLKKNIEASTLRICKLRWYFHSQWESITSKAKD